MVQLSTYDDRWAGGRQQDSQELLISLLEALQSDCDRNAVKPKCAFLTTIFQNAILAQMSLGTCTYLHYYTCTIHAILSMILSWMYPQRTSVWPWMHVWHQVHAMLASFAMLCLTPSNRQRMDSSKWDDRDCLFCKQVMLVLSSGVTRHIYHIALDVSM